MSEERKVALITGITGQDGSYLAEFLLEKGYTVRFLFFACVCVRGHSLRIPYQMSFSSLAVVVRGGVVQKSVCGAVDDEAGDFFISLCTYTEKSPRKQMTSRLLLVDR